MVHKTIFLLFFMQQNGMVWYGMAWHGMGWDGMVWYDIAWYGMDEILWYGVLLGGCSMLHPNAFSLLLFGRMSVQFPIECSLPWMLVEHVLQSPDAGLLESVLMPFDIYNDAADYALRVLKQRFLYDEIEAEVSQMPTTILS
jgi:hypothetical protein